MKYHVLTSAALLALVSAISHASAAEFEKIHLRAINDGNINNNGNVFTGKITGDGTSVSIGAIGAVAQISVSSVNSNGDKNCVCTSEFRDVKLNANNSGEIVNTGTVKTDNIKGAGASISVSALGAGAVISVSSVNGSRR